jgi:hypothetical protein
MVDAIAASMFLANMAQKRNPAQRQGARPPENNITADQTLIETDEVPPQKGVPMSDSDADSEADDDTIVIQPQADNTKDLSSMPAASQLHRLFQTYNSTFALEKIRFDKLNVADLKQEQTKPREVPVPGQNSGEVVNVVEGLNACLTTLIHALFKESSLTKEMKNALAKIVEPRARNAELKSVSDKTGRSLEQFYIKLLSTMTVIQIACEKEDKEATHDTTSTRRPNLRLWEAVLADLTSLQCVFQKGARMGYMPVAENAVDPTSAIALRNRQIARTLRDIRSQERQLIQLHERQADHDEQLQKLERKYTDIMPMLQQATAKIDFLHDKLQSFSDIPLLVAESIASMEAHTSVAS